MLLTRIALRPPPDTCAGLSAGELGDLLWLNVTAADGIQHIHARTVAGRIEVAVFTVASEQAISDYIVERICRRAVRVVPALRGWTVA
ncbi:hypothetical protein Cs7R123_46420 [Catellatospora sp. TT07R-123]|uniref:hypothetical protein n=1 Tax=Catellatospora sp. TT07R-123 TaxID=2733863 RepID=UPI001B04161D|nr:hypothetical protein [Catellatospora sp. TT07R-123]GHJ47300.1 hypothetical protein Cs7R123_46420 [Catellatospora sp. TT07R-123]